MEPFTNVGTNPFVMTELDPFSTFAADVDTASYDVFRRNTEHGLPVDKNAVRVEEFVNYFAYDYPAPQPTDEHPFRIDTAVSQNPLGRDTLLLRVGIQALQPQPAQRKPANLVFLVDTSGSMQTDDKLPLVQYLLTHSLDILNSDDKVSIVTYAGDTTVRLTPTSVVQKEQISQVINGLTAGGSTNGAGGIQLAYQQAESAFIQDGINHVILCTDGDFNVGISDTTQLVNLIKEKRKSGVTLTALGFGLGNLNDAMMEKVSNAGNGMYSVITSRTQASRYAEDRMLSTFLHVAKDMKLQLEWNPEKVYAYRLIGYEDRAIADQNFRNDEIDAGEVGAGHRVTALYEVVLAGKKVPEVAGAPSPKNGEKSKGAREVKPEDLVLVKVRYKQPGAGETDAATEVNTHYVPTGDAPLFADADKNLRYSVAIAAFAEILKKSPYAVNDKLDVLREVFESQAERDIDRKEFLELFDQATAILTH
jgi:Ca-activated chloride channel family protein